MAKMYSSRAFIFVVLCCLGYCLNHNPIEERVIQVLEDSMEAENFTYYRLGRDGYLRLELASLKGDVDIYASSKVQYPSYSDYELKSDSCGMDIIFVPEVMSRPVYIAIYGHPSYLYSKFRLTIISAPQPKIESYEELVVKYEKYYFDERDKSTENEGRKSKSETRKSHVNVEDDQPLWLKILIGILEFGLELII